MTGAGGQLGQALLSSAPPGMIAIGLTHQKLNIQDIGAIGTALDLLQPDWVVNAAAYTAVDNAEHDQHAAHGVNAIGAEHLAKAAAARGISMAHISTDYVFDGCVDRPYRPGDRTNPLNVYGHTKLEGEDRVRAAAPGCLILRTSWLYAAEGQNFVNSMLRLMAQGDEVRVVADQHGCPTAVASLARAVWELVRQSASGMFHYTDRDPASWYDLALAIQKGALERGLLAKEVPVLPIPTSQYPRPARRPAYSVLDCDQTYEKLGWAAPTWRDSLGIVLDEMARN